jgi:hypothetical protein
MRSVFNFTILAILYAIVGCGKSTDTPAHEAMRSSYSPGPANFRVNLTDAHMDGVKEVHVNIQRIELMVSKGGKNARLQIANGLGDVDMLTLRNGILLPTEDFMSPSQLLVHAVRLFVGTTDNYLVYNDGTRCSLQLPSAYQSGIKIIMQDSVRVDENYSYSMIIDFDIESSVVLEGNGKCTLNPVLKLPYFTRTKSDKIKDNEGEAVTQGSDSSTSSLSTGNSSFSDSFGQVITPVDLPIYFP